MNASLLRRRFRAADSNDARTLSRAARIYLSTAIATALLLISGCGGQVDTSSSAGDGHSISQRLAGRPALSAPSLTSGLSAFSNRSIEPFAEIGPLAFALSHPDESIDARSIRLVAESSNPALIAVGDIALDREDPANCSLLIRHRNANTGRSRISIIATDPNGAETRLSFLVQINDRSNH